MIAPKAFQGPKGYRMEKLSKGPSTQRVASAAKERTENRSPSANVLELWPGWILPRVSEKKVETEVHNGS